MFDSTTSDKNHICTTCHSVCAPAEAVGALVGGLLLVASICVALLTKDSHWAIAVTPLSVTGAALAIRSRRHCPVCGSEAIVPLSSPRGHALLPEALRKASGGS